MENKPAQVKRLHSLTIESRTRTTMSGVEKVVASNETALILETSEGGLSLSGSALKIAKFDADSGALILDGTVNQIKYSAAKVSLAKRLFK